MQPKEISYHYYTYYPSNRRVNTLHTCSWLAWRCDDADDICRVTGSSSGHRLHPELIEHARLKSLHQRLDHRSCTIRQDKILFCTIQEKKTHSSKSQRNFHTAWGVVVRASDSWSTGCCCDSPAALLLSSVVQVEEVCNRSRVVPLLACTAGLVLWTSKLSQYVTGHLGQLSPPSLRDRYRT